MSRVSFAAEGKGLFRGSFRIRSSGLTLDENSRHGNNLRPCGYFSLFVVVC